MSAHMRAQLYLANICFVLLATPRSVVLHHVAGISASQIVRDRVKDMHHSQELNTSRAVHTLHKGTPKASTSQLQSETSVSSADTTMRTLPNGVDFVYCWSGESMQTNPDLVRGDDSYGHAAGYGLNEMKVSIQSLQVYAPWFNKAYLLVNGPAEPPAWAANDERVEMVDRCTLFPKRSDCPTNNTFACQSVMHLIPGLKEHFVYMEDDWFLVEPVLPSDFFSADGRPISPFEVSDDDLAEIYGPRKKLPPGPDMPPENVPLRTEKTYPHLALPMLVSFARSLEQKFEAWYAFVRSHKTRFVCCDAASQNTNPQLSCSEDFTRVYPAMLHKYNVSIEIPLPTYALFDCMYCGNAECIEKCLLDRNVLSVSGNGLDVPTWEVVEHLLLRRMALLPVTKMLTNIRLVDVVLAMVAIWVLVSTCRSAGKPTGLLGVPSLPQMAIILAYVCLCIGCVRLQHHTAAAKFSSMSFIAALYLLKGLVSFAIFRSKGNSQEVLATLFRPGVRKFGKLPGSVVLLILGILLASCDILSFVSMPNADPMTYQILLLIRVVIGSLLWQCMRQRILSSSQWLAILLFLAAVITKGVDQVHMMGTVHLGSHVWIMMFYASIGAFANVYAEVLLKDTSMPTDLFNTCTSLWGLVWIVILTMYQQGAGALYFLLASATSAGVRGDASTVSILCCMAALGIVTAYFLKEFSNIAKDLSGSIVMLMCLVLERDAYSKSGFTTCDVLVMTMALLSIAVYSTDPIQDIATHPATDSETFKKTSNAIQRESTS